MGLFRARIFSALEKLAARSPEMPVNFSTSFSSRTKDLTPINKLVANTDKKGVTTYTLTAVQTSQLALDKTTGEYAVATKSLLLEAGTYYLGVQSANAKQGGAADYTVALAGSEFYTQASADDNDWSTAPALAPGFELSGWVGFGDAADYRRLAVDGNGGIYRFDLGEVADPVKFTVHAVNAKTGKLAVVKSVTAAKGKSATTGDLCLAAGTRYVLSVEATGAKTGQNSDYTATMTEVGTFNTANNDWKDVAAATGEFSGLLTTAAGGDKVDFYDLSDATGLVLDMTAGKAKVSFLDANGKAVKVSGVVFADGSVKNNQSNLSLVTDNKSTDRFTLGALDDAVKYLKIEAGAAGANSYNLSLIA